MKLFRKTLALILAVTMVFMCWPQGAAAIAVWPYELSGSNAIITHYNGTTGTVTLPTSLDGHPVIGIADNAFYDNGVLAKVTIPGCITTIGASAFELCDHLTAVYMENGVAAIGDHAFANCRLMDTVTLPPSLLSIGDAAFLWCNGVTGFTVPASVTTLGFNPFVSCASLQNITVDGGNPYFESVGGVLYNEARTSLLCYPAARTAVTGIPATVTQYADYSFEGCAISSITIPSQVTSIGRQTFGFCYNLPSIVIPDTVTSIGIEAFQGCTSLTRVTLPDNMTAVPDFMFYGCTGLPWVIIPASVTNIGTAAFAGCTSMYMVEVDSTALTSIGESAFSGCSSLARAMFFCPRPSIGPYAFDAAAPGFLLCYHVTQPSWAGYAVYPTSPFCRSTFDYMDGSAPEKVFSLITDGHASSRLSPTLAGFYFMGWFKEPAFVNYWDFSTAVITDDIVAYANWQLVPPNKPYDIAASSASYNSIKISWSAVASATGYEVWRATSATGAYTKIGSATGTSFINTGLTTNAPYWYMVRSVNQRGGLVAYSGLAPASPAPVKPVPSAPTNVKATRVTSRSIKVTWNAVAGATKYEVWRAASATGTYTRLTTTAAKSYLNTGLTTGHTYYYKVRAYRLVGAVKVYGPFCAFVARRP